MGVRHCTRAGASPDTSAPRPLPSLLRSSPQPAWLEAHGRITRRDKAGRPWVPTGVGRTMGGSALSLPYPSDRGDPSEYAGHDRFHRGRPCFLTELSGPPIKARRRIVCFCTRSLLLSLLKTSRPQSHSPFKSFNMGSCHLFSPTPSICSDAPAPEPLQEKESINLQVRNNYR